MNGVGVDGGEVSLEFERFVGNESRAGDVERDGEVAGEVESSELHHDVRGDGSGGDVAVLSSPEVGDVVDSSCSEEGRRRSQLEKKSKARRTESDSPATATQKSFDAACSLNSLSFQA